jgi:hypothetical protein
MEKMETFFDSKNANFCCIECDFKCFKLSEWKRHIKTKKHSYRHDGNFFNKMETKKSAEYECTCGKKYTSNSGLWKHKKNCKPEICDETFTTMDQLPKDFKITPQMFYDLLKQNNELQKSLIAIAKEKGPTNITNCGNNNNNKTFNLQIYLNETCKDALNISDFVNQIQLTINDLEETGKLGYAEGISRVFLKNLNGMDSTSRPIHCSDSKRETLYIKDDDEWHKEEDNKPILTKAIKTIANENIKTISEWKNTYPDCVEANSKKNDLYLKIVSNSMSGVTKEECDKNYNKIIKNIVKETVIDKDIIVDKDI